MYRIKEPMKKLPGRISTCLILIRNACQIQIYQLVVVLQKTVL